MDMEIVSDLDELVEGLQLDACPFCGDVKSPLLLLKVPFSAVLFTQALN